MKLARLRIRNFRCYKNEIAFDFDDMTAFIGKNDVGKSTVTDALDIFLNDGTPDKNDANKNGNPKDLTFICEFTDLPTRVILDEDFHTSFQAEYLLNEQDHLEIHKTYSGHIATPKCTNIAAYAVHPTANGTENLLQLKNSDLKRRAKDLNVDLIGVDQRINAQLRQRIRETIGELKLKAALVPLNEENAKKTWDGIKTYIPVLALFKSDRASTDQDAEAQDPLKVAVKEAIKQKEAELKNIVSHVESEVKKIAQKTLEKLNEMDPSLSQQLNPQFTTSKWESLFKVSITGDEDIPLNKRGSGVRRLVLLNFFRAKAEQQGKERDNAPVLYAIEEPETSQHPNNQRRLLSALIELSVENQVLITTHTPMLARSLPNTCLRYIHEKSDKTREVVKGGNDTNKLMAQSLGILPDNSVKLFVGVEGPNDITFLKHMAKMFRLAGTDVLDLEKMEINGELIFFPLGGSTLAYWISRLEKLNRPEFHLFDRDTQPPANPKYKAAADEINQRERCKALHTGKKEMENYLHFSAINTAFAENNIPLHLSANFSSFEDLPMEVAKGVHIASGSPQAWTELDQAEQKKKISKTKKTLNNSAASFMTKERLDEIDQDGDITEWFRMMKELADS